MNAPGDEATGPEPAGLRAWVGDGLVPAATATISAYDRGFRNGEGVFETFRAYGEHVFRVMAHIDRAREGAAELGFDPGDRDHLVTAVEATARANLAVLGGADSALRLIASPGGIDPESPFPGRPAAGPTVVVTSHRLEIDPAVYRDGVRAAAVPFARELPHVKSVSYLIAVTARRQARAAGADEALLTDGAGHVLEGASTNVFAVTEGRLVTPPADAGLLAGVTRAVVVEVAHRLGMPVVEQPLTLTALVDADEAFLTATTREIVPLVGVDDATVGDGRPGAVTARLHAGYREAVERARP